MKIPRLYHLMWRFEEDGKKMLFNYWGFNTSFKSAMIKGGSLAPGNKSRYISGSVLDWRMIPFLFLSKTFFFNKDSLK